MTIDAVLNHLDHVRPTARGWMARCPAHDDRSPSLSIREGDEGRILLHDFAGCRLEEILSAIGLRPADLFPDRDPDPQHWQERKRQRERERARQAYERHHEGLRIDTLREAECVIRGAQDINIEALSDAQVHTILNRLADAYNLLFESEITDGTSGIR